MELDSLALHCEAFVFSSEKPLSAEGLKFLLNDLITDLSIDNNQITEAMQIIVSKYASDEYSFEVKEVGGGYQFLSKKNYHPVIAKLNADKFTKKLSTASLETLAIIAYKQPVTKMEVENIRGVNSDYSVQKLLEKELIVISGRLEDMIGKPLTYNTSKSFMDYLGINSIDDLPKLNEVIQTEMVDPTIISDAPNSIDTNLLINETGKLIEINKKEDND